MQQQQFLLQVLWAPTQETEGLAASLNPVKQPKSVDPFNLVLHAS